MPAPTPMKFLRVIGRTTKLDRSPLTKWGRAHGSRSPFALPAVLAAGAAGAEAPRGADESGVLADATAPVVGAGGAAGGAAGTVGVSATVGGVTAAGDVVSAPADPANNAPRPKVPATTSARTRSIE